MYTKTGSIIKKQNPINISLQTQLILIKIWYNLVRLASMYVFVSEI